MTARLLAIRRYDDIYIVPVGPHACWFLDANFPALSSWGCAIVKGDVDQTSQKVYDTITMSFLCHRNYEAYDF